MPQQYLINFHVHVPNESAAKVVEKWCRDNGRSVSAFYNAMLPAIAFCLQNYTTTTPDGDPMIELNLGPVIVPVRRTTWKHKTTSADL